MARGQSIHHPVPAGKAGGTGASRAAGALLGGLLGVIVVGLLLAGFAGLLAGFAAPGVARAAEPETLDMTVGKSTIIESPQPIHRISLAQPEVADILLLSPRQAYITAKIPGTTNVTMWGKNEQLLKIYDLVVTPDVGPLKSMLHEILPQETGIKVLAAGESITLSGSVSSEVAVTTAVSLAQAYVPKPEMVVNLLNVGGVHQVMLEVRVAEMSRDLARRLGFNWNYAMKGATLLTGNVFYTFLDNLTGFDEQGRFVLSKNTNAAFSTTQGDQIWSGFIDALKENGAVKILAEPNLVCLSGETANFLAGGEIPIPVPQGLGTVAIEWKPFGVGLNFTPTVIGPKRISLQVQPEVSELDYTNALVLESFTIPALTTRRAQTTVELDSGQSFAIGGLMKDNLREAVAKYPVIGDIPVLGALFRSSEFQKNRTELVIIVTPHLVKPLETAGQTLPTDNFHEPNDFEFYLLGLTEAVPTRIMKAQAAQVAAVPPPANQDAGFDGDFGHTLPAY